MNYLVAVDLFYPDQPSGAGRVAWDIGQVMRDRGHSVTFFVRKADPEAAETEIVEGIRVVRFELPKTGALDPWKMQKQAARGRETARRHLLDRRWDVVHIHIALFGKILHSLLGAGPRYVETVHSPLCWSSRSTGRSRVGKGK